MRSLPDRASELLRPEDEQLSPEERAQVQFHRLLSLFGLLLVPLVGMVFDVSNPTSIDPEWTRLGVAGLFGLLLAGSYLFRVVRRSYPLWMRGMLYVLMGWFTTITALNRFDGDYTVGLLVVYAVVIAAVGLGTRTLSPVLRVAGIGFLAAVLGIGVVGAGRVSVLGTNPLVLLVSMAAVALVEITVIQGQLTAREKLRKRDRHVRGLANSIPGVIFQFFARPDGTYGNYFISERAESLLGLSADPEDFFGRFMSRVPPSYRDELLESIDEAVQRERPWHFELPFVKPSGERIWLLGTSMPERRQTELVYNGVLLDITERKEKEQELRRKERRYRAVFEDPNILVGLIDTDGTVLDVNQTALRYVGVAPEEIRGKPFWDTPWFAGDEELQEDVKWWTRKAAAGEYVEFEADLTKAIGEEAIVRGVFRPVVNEEGRVTSLLVSDRDITERKRHERELVQAKEEAEKAARLKSTMLANMSHEVRTPLTSITGFAEMLKENLEGQMQTFATRVYESGQRLQDTLDSVLQLSKLEAGAYDLTLERVNLGEVARQAAQLFRSEAEEKGIDLRIEADSSVEGCWDEAALTRVAENLLSNAVKFTPSGGSVEIRVEENGEEAVLAVEDTGVGMDSDQVPELFQMFQQESEGLTREYEGVGLGLSIVGRLAEAHGGTIEVETEKGAGSCFTVRLPKEAGERDGDDGAG